MTNDSWNPARYERFRDERSQPFYDLLALVDVPPGGRLVDLGCGTGELTRQLHDRLKAANTLGIDSSASMLARAAPLTCGGLRFELRDLRDLPLDEPLDLIFSNAALHWVEDHRTLFCRLAKALADKGQLAVQLPAMQDHPMHRVAAQVARQPPLADLLAGFVHRIEVHEPRHYAAWFGELGFRRHHARLQVYDHRLASREAVAAWAEGTLLTAYEERLGPEAFAEFVARYRAALIAELPDEQPFLFRFRRILLWGAR